MKHYKYGGSTASRTVNCPGWRIEAAKFPQEPEKESEYARRGTLLHNGMEELLLNDMTPTDVLGLRYKDMEVTEELVQEKIIPALEAFDEVCREYKVKDYDVEVMMEVSDKIGGTADILAVSEDALIVLDWKFGDGVIVKAEENQQGMFYAMCALLTEPSIMSSLPRAFKKVVIVIVQPSSNCGNNFSTWETTTQEIVKFMGLHDAAIHRTELVPGSWCNWCPAEDGCSKKTGLADKALLLDPAQMDQLNKSMMIVEEVENWVKAVKKRAHQQADLGAKIAGHKLVAKRAIRRWDNEEEVIRIVESQPELKRSDFIEEKFSSPAQVEKLYKKHGLDFSDLEDHISAISSGTTLAKESDKRSELLVQNDAVALQKLEQLMQLNNQSN